MHDIIISALTGWQAVDQPLPFLTGYRLQNSVKEKIMYIDEIWKPIKGWEKFYEISNYGRVKSLPRLRINGRGIIISKELIRKNYSDLVGYRFTILRKNKRHQLIKIHRLVATHFINNPENKKFVNHKDGNKKNNYYKNLEWVTRSENEIHAYKTGLKKRFIGEDNKTSKLKNFQIIEIRNSELGYKKLSKIYNVSAACIMKVKKRISWKHI